MKTRLDKSIEYIRGYCEKNETCTRCKLLDREAGACLFERLPLNWETLQEREKKAKENNGT